MTTSTRKAILVCGVLALLGATARAVGDPSRNVTTYALLAARQLVGSSFTVRAGDVGVNQGRLRVSRALGASSSDVTADITDLGSGTHCAALFSNFELAAAPGCTGATGFDGPLFTDLPGACGFPAGTFPACDATKDLTIPLFGAQHLDPGAYGDVRIEGKNLHTGGLLVLGPGIYRFCSLRALHGAKLAFDGPAQVYVQGAVRFDTQTSLAPSSGATSAALQLFVQDGDVLFSHRADVHAQLCAPTSTLRVKNGATLTGTFVADTIAIGPGATITRGGAAQTTTTTSVTTTSTSTSTSLPGVCADACGDGIIDPECGEECDGDDLGDATCPGSAQGAVVVDCPRCTADCRLDVTCCGIVVTTTSTSTSSTTSSTGVTATTATSSTLRTTTTSPTTTTSTSRTSTTIAQATTSTSRTTTTSSSTSTSRTTTTSSSTSTLRTTTTSSSTSTSRTTSTSQTTSSSTSTSRSTTSTSRTSTTSSTTSTTLGGGSCPSRLRFTTTIGTTSCGGAALSPTAAGPFSGAMFDANGAKLTDLGLSCLYVGGGGNTATAPNSNPDGPSSLFTVTSCNGSTLNLAPNAGSGAASCTFGTATTKHCTRTGAACTSDTDCGGSTGLCNPDPRCYFGPPLPIPAGPTSTCVLNVFRADASGTVDRTAGTSNISLPLASYVYLTGSATRVCANFAPGNDGFGACFNDSQCNNVAGACQPLPACPRCIPSSTSSTGNRCLSGKRHGMECTPVGTKLTTLDCPPKDNIFIAPLNVTLAPLGTSTTSLTAAANGKFCPTGTAGTCTTTTDPLHCQRSPGCFGRSTCRRFEESGVAAGSLADNQPHPVTIAATFCIPATGNALIDGGTGADLPGPGAVSIRGTFQTIP